MSHVLVTQRVVQEPGGERRDALEQAWHEFLESCGLAALLVPNRLESATRILREAAFAGTLLTGGNDLGTHGGDAPERDRVEALLLRHCLRERLPVLGVCRGMQVVLEHFGVTQVPLAGHVAARQEILVEGLPEQVNSYHRWGCRESCAELEVWARAPDGVVKAVRHRSLPVIGIMWHPERLQPFRAEDVALFRATFRERSAGGADVERFP
jgi:putative glutamine amidotransferase